MFPRTIKTHLFTGLLQGEPTRHLQFILTLIFRLHYDIITVVAYYINHLTMTIDDMNTHTESNRGKCLHLNQPFQCGDSA